MTLSGDNWLYEEVVHSIFYAFSYGVMNWFVREKDEYMFFYENYYLFSDIIDISVDFWTIVLQIIISKFKLWTFIIYFTKRRTSQVMIQHQY
jgi:hypothetical protein